jgi:hypothetical protein
MLELGRDLGLPEEPGAEEWVAGMVPLEELDGDEALEIIVPGPVDDS